MGVHRGVGIAMVVAVLSGCGAAEEDRVRDALQDFGDAPRAAFCEHVTSASRDAMAGLARAQGTAGACSGAADSTITSLRDMGTDVSSPRDADVDVRGGEAVARLPGGQAPLALRREDGAWRVDLTSIGGFSYGAAMSTACARHVGVVARKPLMPVTPSRFRAYARDAASQLRRFARDVRAAPDAPRALRRAHRRMATLLEDHARRSADLARSRTALDLAAALDAFSAVERRFERRVASEVRALGISCTHAAQPERGAFHRRADRICQGALARLKARADAEWGTMSRIALGALRRLADLESPAVVRATYEAALRAYRRAIAHLTAGLTDTTPSAADLRDGALWGARARTAFLRAGLPRCAEL